jgi:hypothetical protein
MTSGRLIRAAVIATALSVGLSACGTDGVELNGKIFDLMGVSDSAQKAAAREPKMTERTGIVMPPDPNRLPEPGSANAEPDIAAQLNDPDRKRQMAAAERERQHKAYCSGELTWKERASGKAGYDGAPTSPFGPCTFIGGILKQ